MNLQALGERKVIAILTAQLDRMPQMPVPFGDDVSAYGISRSKLAVVKTDTFFQKTDMPPGMSYWQAARKAVVMNISDFAAKGVKPLAMLASLGLPKALRQEDVVEIGKGLNAGAREYGAYVIGGDTGESSELVISISLFGIAQKDRLVLRSGAKIGDIVAVTGYFGHSAAGLDILLHHRKETGESWQRLTESVLMPNARLREGVALAETSAVTSSIDSSDGLARSLHEIAKASQVGITIDFLPVDEETQKFAETMGTDLSSLALLGGEEYELVLTIAAEQWLRTQKTIEKIGGKLLRIGRVTSDAGVFLERGGKKCLIKPGGYEHFK